LHCEVIAVSHKMFPITERNRVEHVGHGFERRQLPVAESRVA